MYTGNTNQAKTLLMQTPAAGILEPLSIQTPMARMTSDAALAGYTAALPDPKLSAIHKRLTQPMFSPNLESVVVRFLDRSLAKLVPSRRALLPIAKRTTELLIALTVLVLMSPILVAIAVAIKLESRGPVFFRQPRTGKNGDVFDILKFRTMRIHQSSGVAQATKNDARVTTIGSFLRRSSLDEIPQLLNVLKGNMAIVGPRPHAVEHDRLYSRIIPTYTGRFAVRPGLTGWAQVNNLRGETDTVDKMEMRVKFDLEYIRNPSFRFELLILLMTPLVLLSPKNAY